MEWCSDWEEIYSVRVEDSLGGQIKTGEASVVIKYRSKVPTIDDMRFKACTLARFEMDENYRAWWVHGSGIKIKISK